MLNEPSSGKTRQRAELVVTRTLVASPARLAAAVLLAALASACGSSFFAVRNTAEPAEEREFVVVDPFTTSADPLVLGPFAGDIGAVRYQLGGSRRAFLFQRDLRAGIDGGDFLHLPLLASGEPERVEDITRFPGTWNSFRVYDAGLCSALVPWADDGGVDFAMIGALAPLVTAAFDRALSSQDDCNQRFFRIQEGEVTAVIRAAPDPLGPPGQEVPGDRIRFSSVYQARSVAACSPVNLTLAVEFGFRPVAGTLASADGCAPPDSTPVPGTIDFEGVVHSVSAKVQGFCLFGGAIEDKVASQLNSQLPGLVRVAVREALLVNPTLFGLRPDVVRGCRCPEECDSRAGVPAWPWGTRHSCRAEKCWIGLEPDWLNVRPDGLEVVLMQDEADPQFPIFAETPGGSLVRTAFLCNELRNAVESDRPPRAGTLPFPIRVPTSDPLPSCR